MDEECKIDQLMQNTGIDKTEARNILARNRWNLSESYQEIERMCRAHGHQNNRLAHGGYKQLHNSPSHQRAIDMGLGTAINLDTRWSTPQTPPPSYSSLQFSGYSSYPLNQPDELSVKLPEKIIPIQVEGGRTISGSLPQYESVRSLKSSVDHGSLKNSRSADNEYRSHYPNESQALQKPQSTVSMPHKDDHYDSHPEEDDIFDDRIMHKAPSFNTYPRLKRGFSNILENETLVSEARHSVQIDILKDSHDNMYIQTFVLPDITTFNEDLKAFLEKELIETSTLVSLEQAGRLNWWAELRLCQRLLPMATSGDGNCLLHAASLAMWGIHDRQLILRKELHETLTNARYKDALYRRWRFQQALSNKQSGLMFSEEEWQEEWRNILRLASPQPRGAPDPMRSNNCCDSLLTQGKCEEPVIYESLEEFHVFVLAHVLQRPIIVVADAILKDSNGEALAPIPFPGIYLPLEVPSHFKSPLLLTYDAAHFSALCPMEQAANTAHQLPAAIPLVDPELKLLPLHFYKDPGEGFDWRKEPVDNASDDHKINLLHKFLDVERIPIRLNDINGDSDKGSCGSQDSDESGSLFKDKEKKEKKKDARMSQQMQTVAKQFGSIGKTMGKKLKQLGKTGKSEKTRQANAINEMAQSAKVISNYNNQRHGADYVLVAKLSEKRTKQQQELISNYLRNAKVRFEELKRKSDAELCSKAARYPPASQLTLCHTTGCMQYSSPQTDNFCSKCYNSRWLEHEAQGSKIGHNVYNTFPGRGRPSPSPQSDEILICGKSKFYTFSNESSLHQVPDPYDQPANYSNKSRGRSPSPDYDNFTTRNQFPSHQSQCKTPDCNFYGSQDSNGFCSKCFKKNQEESKPYHAITKL